MYGGPGDLRKNGEWRSYHKPVLLEEVIVSLRCQPGGIFVDGTIGGGGHARRILEATSPDGLLIGLDRDDDALQESGKRLASFGARKILRKANFCRMAEILCEEGIEKVDGILLDLGVSSHQLDTPERGFSFSSDAPLDMRMDKNQTISAYEFINHASEAELQQVIWECGEETMARRIARAIVRARRTSPVMTTTSLGDIVVQAIPPGQRNRRIHPATKTFQAIRIHVNDELNNLRQAISSGVEKLKDGGRFSIISFQSLEDRIVKNAFRLWSKSCVCPPDIPLCICGHQARLRILTAKPITPATREINMNPRARSARLRTAERI
ncbi:MAG: 16S rRNA (cytosine(1402)-N(4))-methyltransferase RsmH [Syntrophales bacterium]|jgi:16S rRNA (cytosine1402-N4)-methyltransferase|nr:16S rRNA (cytosine(1402)-N(4))-methyltransferase RsmH [Syntrophales bacterium]